MVLADDVWEGIVPSSLSLKISWLQLRRDGYQIGLGSVGHLGQGMRLVERSGRHDTANLSRGGAIVLPSTLRAETATVARSALPSPSSANSSRRTSASSLRPTTARRFRTTPRNP